VNKTLKIAHRGIHHNFPENSLSSFKNAIEAGADAIELDVRLTLDEKIIVFHDPWLKRMLGKSGKVNKKKLAEIKKIPYSAKKDEFVPTLAEIFEEIGGKILLNIEIKDIRLYNHQIARKISQLINDFNLYDSVWISSFNPLVLDFLKTINKKIKTGFLFDHTKYISLLISSFIKVDAWHPNFSLVDQEVMTVAKKKNVEIYPWTVNEQKEIERLKFLEVHGIISDNIQKI
jgi:glycerophosphoryl diester phosphodiesterase